MEQLVSERQNTMASSLDQTITHIKKLYIF